MKIWRHIVGGVLSLCVLAGGLQAQQAGLPAARPADAQSISEGKKAIEDFMSQTALWVIDMEWTFGHDNKTPTAADRAKAMLAADISKCPADFQEAWKKQVENPNRNYADRMFRKYGVDLSLLRERLQKELAAIDPTVRPPVPLYNDDETPPRYDPTTCGSKEAILAATTKLRARLNGIDPEKAVQWQKAINRVMLEFMICYVETLVSMNSGGIPQDEVETMFNKIDVKDCPPDFVAAWKHDLPHFLKGEFGGADFMVYPACKRYGVDEEQSLKYVKKKMDEWKMRMPTKDTLLEFRVEFKSLKAELLDYR